jgi:hypothetical protein
VHGREVRLTRTQYKLFAMMMRNAGKVLTNERILLSVWGPSFPHETQYLRVYMGQLRRKFEENPARSRHFITTLELAIAFGAKSTPNCLSFALVSLRLHKNIVTSTNLAIVVRRPIDTNICLYFMPLL